MGPLMEIMLMEIIAGFFILIGLWLVSMALDRVAEAIERLAANEIKIRGIR